MIIKTKLYSPSPKADFVKRIALIEQLNQAKNNKLTIVSAPAGFGKSHLVASWCKEVKPKYAWLSLDLNDNNPDIFLAYLVAAIRSVDANLAEDAWHMTQGKEEKDAGIILTSLVNELAYYPEDLHLILDDYHLIQSEQIDKIISQLLELSPNNFHLLLVTRIDPNLPLAKYRAQGELQELRAADLRFCDDEANAFFNLPTNISLSDRCTRLANKNTEGWIVGLQLSALALRGQSNPDATISRFRGTHTYILDYLTEEVLTKLPDEIRRFLFDTYLLSEFNAELCDYVLDIQNSAQHIAYLEQHNIFIISLDDERVWFRYHHLFADVLKVHAKQSEQHNQALHWRAALWFAEQGRLIEAVKHGFLADNTRQVVSLVEKHWPSQRVYHHDSQLIAWLKDVSISLLQDHPVLSGYYGLALLSHDPEKGMYLLDSTRRALAESKMNLNEAESTTYGIVNIGEAYIHAAQNNIDEVLERARTAFENLNPDEAVWRGSAKALEGIALWQAGQIQDARKSLNSAVTNMDRSKDTSAQITSRFLLADFYYQFGWLNQAKHTIESAIAIADTCHGYTIEGSADAYLLLAEIEFEQGSIDKANINLDIANQFGERGSMPETRYRYPLLSGRIANLNGKFDNALQLFNEAENLFHQSPAPCHRPPVFWKDVLYLNQGNNIKVKKEPSASLALHMNSHAYLPYLLASLESVEQVEAIFSSEETLDSTPRSFYIKLLIEAISHDLKGNTEQAKASLKTILTELSEHQDKVWINEVNVLKHFFERHHLIPKTRIPSIVKQDLVEPLSTKEKEVLNWLDSELTGPQIASRLFVSLNTLRTHTKNIYSKLDVNNRRAAINKAKSLGYLNENTLNSIE